MTHHTDERARGGWTPQKLDKAWRVFDRALLVMADGIDVPADELRAFLIDGEKPALVIDQPKRAIRTTLQERIVQCHEENPLWNGRQVAKHLDASYDTVRGLASRAGIVWFNPAPPPRVKPEPPAPKVTDYQAADNAFLAQHGSKARFRLRDEHGDYLHMAVVNNLRTNDQAYAWRGTRDQLRAVREKYEFARPLKIVAVSA